MGYVYSTVHWALLSDENWKITNSIACKYLKTFSMAWTPHRLWKMCYNQKNKSKNCAAKKKPSFLLCLSANPQISFHNMHTCVYFDTSFWFHSFYKFQFLSHFLCLLRCFLSYFLKKKKYSSGAIVWEWKEKISTIQDWYEIPQIWNK